MGTVAKGTTRAAVHGSRSPATTTLHNKEEVETAVERGREQKHKAREEVEDKVDASIADHRQPTTK
uniref:Uncharacterized protein n=1 Tax=Oryza sativa subsp. japonica TaxID=39947 RepID=Q84YS1_ORYSJ|nr:hypothetical protein [Oryza sativa Japonica Group]